MIRLKNLGFCVYGFLAAGQMQLFDDLETAVLDREEYIGTPIGQGGERPEIYRLHCAAEIISAVNTLQCENTLVFSRARQQAARRAIQKVYKPKRKAKGRK